ncbi:hypothetical protein [Priestia megaterium]|uniref:hypothetical protein n=1 Tax=Priestia megaterium TaxID=1404 RepID=UPI002E1B48D4|nr:hypothetical protein [Priestia megaterium]
MLDAFKDFEMSVAAIVNGNGSFEQINDWVTDSVRADIERRIENALNETELSFNDLSLIMVVKPYDIQTLSDLYAMKYRSEIKTKYGNIEILATPECKSDSGVMNFAAFVSRTTKYLWAVIQLIENKLNPKSDIASQRMLDLYKYFYNKYLYSLSVLSKKTIN